MARGSVFRRGDVWCIRYDAGYDENGRRRQPFESGFTNRPEADARLAMCLAEVATGRHVPRDRTTFAAYARYWLDTVIPGTVRETSRITYADTLTFHLLPAFGTLALQAIKPAHIHRYFRTCEAAGLASNTRRASHARLVQIFACAVDEGLLAASPMAKIAPPRAPKKEIHTWSLEEIELFLRVSADEDLGPLWHTYALTGLRDAEALGIRWRDVDLAKGMLHIRQQMVDVARGVVEVGPLKTPNSYRTVALGPRALSALQTQRTRQVAWCLAAASWPEHDLLFTHHDGRPWSPQVISSSWHRRLVIWQRAHPLSMIRLHDLRHTHITHMLAQGANVKMLAERMGHDPVVLLRTYAHVIPGQQADAAARFEAALNQPKAVELGG